MPKITKEVRSFLGLVGYYRWFIDSFAKLAWSLTELTHNNAPFKWLDAYKKSFQEINERLTSTLVLALLIEGKDYDLYTNDSLQGLGVVLMQKGKMIVYGS